MYRDHVKFKFITDDYLNGLLEQIRSHFIGPSVGKVARLVGLSGLGKTRLALEAFRPPTNSSKDPALFALSMGVVYIRRASDSASLVSQVIDWRNQNVRGLIVVDGCIRDMHDQLAQEIRHSDSRLSLLTLDLSGENSLIAPIQSWF
jgi:hypothetical protein